MPETGSGPLPRGQVLRASTRGWDQWMPSVAVRVKPSGRQPRPPPQRAYGHTGIYGYARNCWTGSCLYRSNIELNNTYRSSAHHVKTVTIPEIGHSLGFNHHGNCDSIMYTNPTACAAAGMSCDAQAAGLYPY